MSVHLIPRTSSENPIHRGSKRQFRHKFISSPVFNALSPSAKVGDEATWQS